jgi:hypothetical protein
MKLHDAIEEAMLSKTRIRRSSWDEGVYKPVGFGGYGSYYAAYTEEEILADDWVVEEMAVKPCPLCGNSVKLEREHNDISDYSHCIIICSNYKCSLLLGHSEIFSNRREIIEAWNTRA